MLIPEFIIGLVLIFVVLIAFMFYSSNRKLKDQHCEQITMLINDVALHQKQIRTRHANLRVYDFLKYNLKDALVIQPEIVVYPSE